MDIDVDSATEALFGGTEGSDQTFNSTPGGE